VIEEPTNFLRNLKFQIKRKEEFLDKSLISFRAQIRNCIESFEEVYYREAYKELINELRDRSKTQE
jgi:hypothetical protein